VILTLFVLCCECLSQCPSPCLYGSEAFAHRELTSIAIAQEGAFLIDGPRRGPVFRSRFWRWNYSLQGGLRLIPQMLAFDGVNLLCNGDPRPVIAGPVHLKEIADENFFCVHVSLDEACSLQVLARGLASCAPGATSWNSS